MLEDWFSTVFQPGSTINKQTETVMVVGSSVKVRGDVRFTDPYDTLVINGNIQGPIIPPSRV